jgi:predicted GIY-YIG superfamily endonuclease
VSAKRRGQQATTGPLGVVYMLHFHRPYRHARHYVGWTEDLLDRLDQHAAGRGARLVAVILQAGIGFTLVRVCEGTRRTERAIKNDGGAVRFCPACTSHPWNGHWSAITGDLIPRTYPGCDAKEADR